MRVSLAVMLFGAALWMAAGVTVLPRAKPDINASPESLPEVVYAPVVTSQIQQPPPEVRLDSLERRLRMIQSKVDRIEAKAEGK